MSSSIIPSPDTLKAASFFNRPALSEIVTYSEDFVKRSQLFSEIFHDLVNVLVKSLSLSRQRAHAILTNKIVEWKNKTNAADIGSPLTAFLDIVSLLSHIGQQSQDTVIMDEVFQSQILPKISPISQNTSVIVDQKMLLGSPIYTFPQASFRVFADAVFGLHGKNVRAFYQPANLPLHPGYVCLNEDDSRIYHEVVHVLHDKLGLKRDGWQRIFIDEAVAYMAGNEGKIDDFSQITLAYSYHQIPNDVHDALYQLKYIWWLLVSLDIEPHKICLYALETSTSFDEMLIMLTALFIDQPCDFLDHIFISRGELLENSHDTRSIFLEELVFARIHALLALRALQKHQTYSSLHTYRAPLFQFEFWRTAKIIDIPLPATYLISVGYYLYDFPGTTREEGAYIFSHLTIEERQLIHSHRVVQQLAHKAV